MQHQCLWYSNLEDVRDHQPDRVLWYKHGYERGPLIFPAGSIPSGAFTRIGTISELLAAMEQALASDASLGRSMKRRDALIIQAQINEQGTTYRFRAVPDRSFLSEAQLVPLL